MGWVLEMAETLGIKSGLDITKRMEREPSWPREPARSIGYIANKVRELDKRKATDWWLGTGKPYLPALAAVLGESEHELLDLILNHRHGPIAGEARLLSFAMFPALRPLNPKEEGLFPGIPEALTRVGGPKAARTWWVAPPGAGKSILGRWLQDGYGWTYIRAESWSELRPQLPSEGRIYVELRDPEGAPSARLGDLGEQLKLCVSCPLPAPQPKRPGAEGQGLPNRSSPVSLSKSLRPRIRLPKDRIGGWIELRPPAISAYILPLLEWVGRRVHPGGGYEHDKVRRLFRRKQMHDLFDTAGDVLGFLGLIDKVGLPAMLDEGEESIQLSRLILLWLKALLEREDRACDEGLREVFRVQGAEILLGMEKQRILRGHGDQLSRETWLGLLPSEFAPELSRSHLLKLLKSNAKDRDAQMQAALQPDAETLLDGLQQLGVLGATRGGQLQIFPLWLSGFLENEVISELVSDIPLGMGALLRHSDYIDEALRDLVEDVRAVELGRLTRCLDAGSDSPEAVLCADAAFRAIGVGLLLGADIPVDLVRRAYDSQIPLLREPWPQQPKLPFFRIEGGGRHSLGGMEGWYLASMVVQHHLWRGEALPSEPSANLWSGPMAPASDEGKNRLLEQLSHGGPFQLTVAGEATDLLLALDRFGGQLLDDIGMLRTRGQLSDFQCIDLLVRSIQGQVDGLKEGELDELHDRAFDFKRFAAACQRRGLRLEEGLAACWRVWGKDNGTCRPRHWLSRADSPLEKAEWEVLWRSLAEDALSEALIREMPVWLPIDAPVAEALWVRWLQTLEHNPPVRASEVLKALPLSLLLDVVSANRLGPQSWSDPMKAVWERSPEDAWALLNRWGEGDVQIASSSNVYESLGPRLVYTCPVALWERALESLVIWREREEMNESIRHWAWDQVVRTLRDRKPGWRRAFEALKGWGDL